MNILDTLDDPALFGPHFRGDTWEPWRAFLAALFGLPMSEHQTGRLPPPHGPPDPAGDSVHEAALICGRRGGKSRVLALIAAYLATFPTTRRTWRRVRWRPSLSLLRIGSRPDPSSGSSSA